MAYPIETMVQDIMLIVKDASAIIVPGAVIVGSVAFVVAWFTDAIDIAGKTFGRHR
jgi:hypothetical protein